MVTIAVGVQNRPPTAPQDGVWVSDYKLVGNPSFTKAISAVSSIVYAYSGTPGEPPFVKLDRQNSYLSRFTKKKVLLFHKPRQLAKWCAEFHYPGFFPIVSEMRNPSLYTRPLLIAQSTVTAIYITVGVVIYYYCGSYVASPALGSAGILIKKISYGISFPGLIVSTIITIHVSAKWCLLYFIHSIPHTFQFPSKYVFLRLLRGSEHLTANSFKHWATWLGCTFSITTSSYLIASGIPIFSDLVSLIGALLGTAMSFQPMGCMWLYDNWRSGREAPTVKWVLLSSWSILVVISGSFLMVAGTYGSVVNIIASSKAASDSSAWSCADNSSSWALLRTMRVLLKFLV